MTRELGVISDIQAAELLIANENLTLGFDATTQEGLHVNSIHVTSSDQCQLLALDQLPGGTAEDYSLHISQTVDSITDVYCKFYSVDFDETRKIIIDHIRNTMTDRATVNHATISRLESSWRTKFNELNCHLHPLDTIASSVRSALKTCEPSTLSKALFGAECISHQLILAFNKFRYKDGRGENSGDPKGFISALLSAGLPKGLLPRYRGNRLHIMFNIAGKLHYHNDFFIKFLSEGTVTCGGLQTAILSDYQSTVSKLEFKVLGLIGKLLSGPWMTKFYTSKDDQFSHVDGILVVKQVIEVIKEFAEHPLNTLTTATDFFGNVLPTEDHVRLSLQSPTDDRDSFIKFMSTSLLAVVSVLERQYSRYFQLDLSEQLQKETESARCHNIDAENIMGMFSAAKAHAPNATMDFLSSRIRAQKNNVVDFLDSLPQPKKESLINFATNIGRKGLSQKRKKNSIIQTEIARRMQEKKQKKVTLERNKLERKLKSCDLANLSVEFPDFDEAMIHTVSDILTEKAVGRNICHVWYDATTQEKTLYLGKFGKVLKKAEGTYRVAYWLGGRKLRGGCRGLGNIKICAGSRCHIYGDLIMS